MWLRVFWVVVLISLGADAPVEEKRGIPGGNRIGVVEAKRVSLVQRPFLSRCYRHDRHH
jgi:hypothetical protein